MNVRSDLWPRRVVGAACFLALWIGAALVPRLWFGAAGTPQPQLLLWFVTVGAFGCLVLSLAAWWVGIGRDQAEVVLLGGAFSAMSILAMAHGLGAPGALVDHTVVSEVSMALAFPVTALGLVPLFVPGELRSRLARHAVAWSSVTMAVAVVASVAVWFLPPTVSVPPGLGALMGGAVVVVTARVAGRQLRLWRIGRHPASLVAATGIVGFGLATAVGLRALPYSPGFWLVHVTNNVAVLALGAGLIVGYRHRRDLQVVLGPVLSRDPLVALEAGLSPEIRAFLVALARKDSITRDHVVRTSELSLRIGERMHMGPTRLRELGLGALMHDIGKLVVPDDILHKPGALTGEEYATMRTHAERGAALLERSPSLGGVAPLVRAHHERWDGGGYPDGLAVDQIPLGATVISAADSWDAMTHTRQYRRGIDLVAARQIMLDGAGSQWSPAVIELLIRIVDEGAVTGLGSFREHSGAATGSDAETVSGDGGAAGTDDVGTVPECVDALPPAVLASWVSEEQARCCSEMPTEQEVSVPQPASADSTVPSGAVPASRNAVPAGG